MDGKQNEKQILYQLQKDAKTQHYELLIYVMETQRVSARWE